MLAAFFRRFDDLNASLGEAIHTRMHALSLWHADVKEACGMAGGHVWRYYMRHLDRKGPLLVMVHGFGAEGMHWLPLLAALPAHWRAIVVDLPGFGASDYRPDADYSMAAQSRRLDELLDMLAPGERVHLLGSSMGGFLSMQLALDYPSRVASLALFAPGGVALPGTTLRQLLMDPATGRPGFDVQSRQEFVAFLRHTLHKLPALPRPIGEHLARDAIARRERHWKIFSDLEGSPTVNARLHELNVPTLVVWGREDRILPVAMAEVLGSGIRNARCVVLDGVGHAPFVEAVGACAREYGAFVEAV